MNRNIGLMVLALSTFGLAWYVYWNVYQIELLQSIFYALSIFALDIKTPAEFLINPAPKYWQSIYLVGILAFIVISATVFSLYLKLFRNENKRLKILSNGNYILVIGLGESNRVYIDSVLEKNKKNPKDIVIIEKNKDNPYIAQYEEKVLVLIGDASESSILENIKPNEKNPIVISTDNDMTNLEIATQLLAINSDVKLFIHIEDRNLRHFHKENGILSGKHIKVYSYQEEAAREVFEKYDIDGEGMDVIHGRYPYAIAVVGNTSLSYEVIAQACIMGQLPNANQLTIYCVDTECESFKESVELHFPEIEQVPNVNIEYIKLDVDTKAFYIDNLWQTKMTNIVLCFDNDQKNLDVAATLTNLTFLDKVVDGTMQTNILIAMFNGYSLSDKIKSNNDTFKHLHVFGGIREINDEKYIIAGERDKQAISTNFIYENIKPTLIDFETYKYEYNTYGKTGYGGTGFVETTEDGWAKLLYFEKESNRAVADQMKMKLKYLGLEIVPSLEKNIKLIYDTNKELFYSKMKDRILLAKMEHNRWNAFHYLNGFRAIEFVSKEEKENLKYIHKSKKIHMCLVEFDEFKKRSDELVGLGYDKGQFEGYDFMINEHIPLILANACYEIIKMKTPIVLGVTGHRSITSDKIGNILDIEFEKLSKTYIFKTVVSPLADGADRVVANKLMDNYGTRLIVPMPFELKEYQKDFNKQSKEEFEKYRKRACSIYKVDSLKNNDRDACYLNVGKEVVDKCDILIALWDGKEVNGVGGTGDIVNYAQEKKKLILHINTETLEMDEINFEKII